MTVEVRTADGFGVVRVDDFDVLEAERFARGGEKQFKTCWRGEVETVDVAVARVEAEADGDVEIFLGELLNDGEFGQIAAELRAGSRGVFEQQGEARIGFVGFVNGAPGEGDGFGDVEHALFKAEAFVIAGMDDEILCADDDAAFEFAAKRMNGAFAHG